MYFDALKNFDNKNRQLINNIFNANTNIYNLILEISKKLITEYQNDYLFFENFLYNYIKYNGLIKSSTIYDMFDCSILRYDLIDFYDIAIHKFNKVALIQIILITFAGILLYISQYFSVRLIYVFDKDFDENYSEEESEEEDEIDEIEEIENEDDIIKNKKKTTSREKFEIESNNHLSSVNSGQNEKKENDKDKNLLLNKYPVHINYFTPNKINRKTSEFTNTESSNTSSQNKLFKTKNNKFNSNESEEKNLKNSQSLVNNGNIRGLYKNTSLKNQLKLSTQNKSSSSNSNKSSNLNKNSNKESNIDNSENESENEDKLSE